jgi:hypothetical protein
LQTSANRSHLSTGSDGLPDGLLLDELEPGPHPRPTSRIDTITRGIDAA